jgi:hypothetical protein
VEDTAALLVSLAKIYVGDTLLGTSVRRCPLETSANDTVSRVHVLSLKRKDDFIGFWQWLFPTSSKRLKLSALLAILSALLAIAYKALLIEQSVSKQFQVPPITIEGALKIFYLLQIVVIFTLLLRFAFVVPPHDERFGYGNKGTERVRLWWKVALFSFFLLYIFLWGSAEIATQVAEHGMNKDLAKLADNVFSVLANLCNNGSTFAFLMCFSSMEWPARDDSNKQIDAWVLCWAGCLLMLTFVEIAFKIKGSETIWFDLLTGANAGIALAMFCGRLSSPLISPPLLVTALLYLYAVLQISFGFWNQQKTIALIMSTFCLVLKVLLALVITWLISTRHLMLYMERLHWMQSQVDDWRKEMRERRAFARRTAKAS